MVQAKEMSDALSSTDNFTVGKKAGQKTSGVNKVLYLHSSMSWTLVAVDGNQGCESRVKLPVSTRLYIPVHQGMCVEIAGEIASVLM